MWPYKVSLYRPICYCAYFSLPVTAVISSRRQMTVTGVLSLLKCQEINYYKLITYVPQCLSYVYVLNVWDLYLTDFFLVHVTKLLEQLGLCSREYNWLWRANKKDVGGGGRGLIQGAVHVHLSGVPRKITKNLDEVSWSPGRNLHADRPDYGLFCRTEMSNIQPRCLVSENRNWLP